MSFFMTLVTFFLEYLYVWSAKYLQQHFLHFGCSINSYFFLRLFFLEVWNWLCYVKICKGLKLNLSTSFFSFNNVEENPIFFYLFAFLHCIIGNNKVNLKYGAKIVKHPNFESVFNCDILFFNTSPKSIVFWAILRNVFVGGIDKLINRSDNCPLTCSILKNIDLLQLFPENLS